jgi:hypothetical protein
MSGRVHHLSEHTLLLHLLLTNAVAEDQHLHAGINMRRIARGTEPERRSTSLSDVFFMFLIAAISTHVTRSLESMTKRIFKETMTRPEAALIDSVNGAACDEIV